MIFIEEFHNGGSFSSLQFYRKIGSRLVLIVQLSTNDVSQNKALGTISNSKNIESFDDKTVLGAIEFIATLKYVYIDRGFYESYC